MERPTLVLGLSLVLVGTGSGAIIWNQHLRIQELSSRTRNTVQSRAVLDRPAPSAEAQPPEIAVEPPASEAPQPASALADQVRSWSPFGPGGRERNPMMLADLLADPEVAALMLSQRRAALDTRYAPLFRRLGLNPAETEALKNLLAERQLDRMEAGAVARAEGLGRGDREEVRSLVEQSDAESDARLQELLGPDRFNTLKTYEQTAPQRLQVDQFALRLSYSPTPLQPFQADAMVRVLAATTPPQPPGRRATPEETAAYLTGLETYNSAVLAQARGMLNPDQLDSLRQMQQEQIDRARLSTLMPFQGRR